MKKWLSGILFFAMIIASPVFAGEVTIGLEWDANVETYLAGYKAYVADIAGGPYTEFADINEPTTEVEYVYVAPDGVVTTKYFVVTAYRNDPFLESGNSNEVFMVYDFAPIEVATEFLASLAGDDIIFTWKQGDIERVKEWKLFMSEVAGGPYADLAVIIYTGTPGEQYSTTESMTVPAGEMKTFYFVLVTFTPTGVFSDNSLEVSITIDKRELVPVYNLKIKVITQ